MPINYDVISRNREIRKAKEEEERKKNEGPNWGNILLGAASAYLTAGLAPALIGGTASLAATPTTVISGIKGAAEGYASKSGEEAAIKGTVQGITPTAETWTATEKAARSAAIRKTAEEKFRKEGLLPKEYKIGEEGGITSTYENPLVATKAQAGIKSVAKPTMPAGKDMQWVPTGKYPDGSFRWEPKSTKPGININWGAFSPGE